MSSLYTFRKFFEHMVYSRRWDSFHSPYLFNLFRYCCDDKIVFPEFDQIESLRSKLVRSTDFIERTDFGAGMANSASRHKTRLSSIARQSLSLPFQCRFLYRMMKFTKPKTCIEFGTSLGIASSYIALGAATGYIITVEGDPLLASMSRKVFEEQKIKNIRIINSGFEEFVMNELKELETIDFVFLDGNHRSGPLLNYYEALRPHFTTDTIVMIDDIYWSSDMHSAWQSLIKMPEVKQSVECFQFGLLFFNSEFINKQNHIIRLPIKSFK